MSIPQVKHYILDGHTPVVVDMMEKIFWEINHGDEVVVAQHDVPLPEDPHCWVSTCFLTIAIVYEGQEPFLFETMVFGGPGGQDRYKTWEEAEKGHALMLERVGGTPVPRNVCPHCGAVHPYHATRCPSCEKLIG